MLVIAGFAAYYIRRRKQYRKYISMPGFSSGKTAVAEILSRANMQGSLLIYQPQKRTLSDLDPFHGNAYLPDENIFVMRREIMDGKSLLSFCVGCQLAIAAINYAEGNLKGLNNSLLYGEFAIRYKFNEAEILRIKEADDASKAGQAQKI